MTARPVTAPLITADEARELAKLSDASVAEILALLDPMIRTAATDGKRRVELPLIDDLSAEVIETARDPNMTAFAARLARALQDRGFRVEWLQRGPAHYQPCGGVSEDEPLRYRTFGLEVRW